MEAVVAICAEGVDDDPKAVASLSALARESIDRILESDKTVYKAFRTKARDFRKKLDALGVGKAEEAVEQTDGHTRVKTIPGLFLNLDDLCHVNGLGISQHRNLYRCMRSYLLRRPRGRVAATPRR